MKFFSALIITLYCFTLYSQNQSIALKFIPEIALKAGSQTPHIGGQFNIIGGVLYQSKYYGGIGFGYATNMGMGGRTIPLYLDTRLYFSIGNSYIFKKYDEQNNFAVEFQIGALINNNLPYKTGFITSGGIAYRFDFLKIKSFKLPGFYFGPNLEFNYTKIKDNYRGYDVKNGSLMHLMLNLKIAFDINSIKLNPK